jgi:hypothetical protein
MYRLNTIPIKISADFDVKFDKLNLKFTWKSKGPRIAKIVLTKENSHFPILAPQSYDSQDSVVLAQGCAYKSMEYK